MNNLLLDDSSITMRVLLQLPVRDQSVVSVLILVGKKNIGPGHFNPTAVHSHLHQEQFGWSSINPSVTF